jgi:hypothetical protein
MMDKCSLLTTNLLEKKNQLFQLYIPAIYGLKDALLFVQLKETFYSQISMANTKWNWNQHLDQGSQLFKSSLKKMVS